MNRKAMAGSDKRVGCQSPAHEPGAGRATNTSVPQGRPTLARGTRVHQLGFHIPVLILCVTIFQVCAFPPAPPHSLFGMIRDEMGNPLALRDAEVILETPTGTTIRRAVAPGLEPGVNYRLAVPLDAAVRSDVYRRDALQVAVPFKMRVRIGQSVYLPIEMQGEFSKLGKAAESTRLDLTLGEDANGNGLPDAWERAILAVSGSGLTEVSPGDDSDGDGLSNMDEYLAGTNAFDSQDGFSLKVVDAQEGSPALEFLSIRGHTYKVFGSADLDTWTQSTFRVASDSADAPARQNYQASDSRIIRVVVNPAPEQAAMRFFRLGVE